MWMLKTTQGLLRHSQAQSYFVFPKGHVHITNKGTLSHSIVFCPRSFVCQQPLSVRLNIAPLACTNWARFLSDSKSSRNNGNIDGDTTSGSGESGLRMRLSVRNWKSFRQKPDQTTNEPLDDAMQQTITDEELAETLRLLQKEKQMLKDLKSLQKRQVDRMNVYLDVWDAKTDYLLTTEDLEMLTKYQTRNPYSSTKGTDRIDVVHRSEVEERVIKKFGSMETMLAEKKRRERHSGYDAHSFGDQTEKVSFLKKLVETFSLGAQSRVVACAIIVNLLCTVFKAIIWYMTGSSSMFAEFLHSGGDLLNQILLGYALYQAHKKPDGLHPYGYKNHLFIWPIVTGVGIFCFGFGLTLYHGLLGLFSTVPFASLHLNYAIPVLLGSLLSEGTSLIVAHREIYRDCKKHNTTYSDYMLKGGEPLIKVVFLEDLVAVLGVVVCGGALLLSELMQSRIYDALGSLVISAMLGGVSIFLIRTNAKVLVGQSIPYQDKVKRQLEDDLFVHMVMDDKGTDLGDESRYKAEVGFDGHRISLDVIQGMDVEALLQECQSIKTTVELEDFLSKFGSQVLEQLGCHIDRIEADLKKTFPEIKHIDIEPN